MESRLKERLTGAAILVALIVLIVPEVFHGRRGGAAATRPAASGTPTRSYTIELGSPPAPAPILAPAPAAQAAAAAAPAPAPAPAAEASVAASAVPAPPAPASASGVPTSAPKAPLLSSAHAAPGGTAHRHGPGGGWTVQLGLFAKAGNAQRLAHTAHSKGFAVGVTRFGTRGLYRVAVAGLADRAAAEQVSHRLRGAGLPAAIVGPR